MNDFLKSILDGIHMLIPSYGWALVAFTLLIKVCLLPLDYKSRKGMRKMSALAPKQAELQKKYGHDQEKLQRKLSELYKKEGASPMAGCWPMLISMPILFAMFAAMRYMANEQLVKQTFDILLTGEPVLEPFLWVKNLWMPDSPFAACWPDLSSLQQIPADVWQRALSALPADTLAVITGAVESATGTVISYESFGTSLQGTITAVYNALAAHPDYAAHVATLPGWNFNLILTTVSVMKEFNGLFILPILSAVTQFVMSSMQQPSGEGSQQSGGTNAFMKWFFPLFSLWLCFSYNAAFALYWAVSNVIAVGQYWAINWYLDRKEKNADAAVEGKIK